MRLLTQKLNYFLKEQLQKLSSPEKYKVEFNFLPNRYW